MTYIEQILSVRKPFSKEEERTVFKDLEIIEKEFITSLFLYRKKVNQCLIEIRNQRLRLNRTQEVDLIDLIINNGSSYYIEHLFDHDRIRDLQYKIYEYLINHCQEEKLEKIKSVKLKFDNKKSLIVERNTRLVLSVSNNSHYRKFGVEDTFQEGCIGLLRAVEKFNYHLDNKFSTYAIFWIKQAIRRSITDKNMLIRKPVHLSDIIYKLGKLEDEYQSLYGKLPDNEYLSKKLETKTGTIETLRQVRSHRSISLDAPIGDSQLTLIDVIDNNERVDDEINEKEIKNFVNSLLSDLNRKESHIVRLRFGLDDHNPMTLEEVGKKYGLTRERIRQIQELALRKIRHKLNDQIIDRF